MTEKLSIQPSINNHQTAGAFFQPAPQPVLPEVSTLIQKEESNEPVVNTTSPVVDSPVAAPPTSNAPPPADVSPGAPAATPNSSATPPIIPPPYGTNTYPIDWFAMGQPYFNRSVPTLRMDSNSGVEQQWMIGYNFGRTLGLTTERSAWLSNKLTPAAIDFNLANDHPTRWELMNRELNVSPIMLPIPAINFELEVNQPNDAAEQEADYMAEKIVAEDAPKVSNTFFKPAAKPIQRSENNNYAPQITQQVNDILQQSGEPLPKQVQGQMEGKLGHDFSGVKVHNNSTSAEASHALQAKAFTSGNNIVFGEGYYNPGTKDGQKLIAHELVHVVQQSQTSSTNTSTAGACSGCRFRRRKPVGYLRLNNS